MQTQTFFTFSNMSTKELLCLYQKIEKEFKVFQIKLYTEQLEILEHESQAITSGTEIHCFIINLLGNVSELVDDIKKQHKIHICNSKSLLDYSIKNIHYQYESQIDIIQHQFQVNPNK